MEDIEERFELEEQYRANRWRKLTVIGILFILVFIVTGWALSYSESDLGFFDCYGYVINHILGKTYPAGSPEWAYDYNIWKFDVPRVLMAITIGGGLAICGVAMQSLMNNPLAEPYTAGISDGACFGAVAAIVMGFGKATFGDSMGLVITAFVCGLIPAFVIIFLSRVVRLSPATAILIGIALSYLFSGLESAVMVMTDPDTLKQAYLWQIGSLSKVNWTQTEIAVVVTLICTVFLAYCSNKLNLLSLGDDSAKSLGLNVDNFRTLTMIVISITVASTVSFVGIVGFVGLVAPHMMRMIIGGDNKYLIPASFLTGALFIQIADTLAHNAFDPELRLGLLVSIIGAPVFLYIILKRKKNYGEEL